MKKLTLIISFFLITITFLSTPALAEEHSEDFNIVNYKGKVINVEEEKLNNDNLENQGISNKVQIVTIKISDGPFEGQEHTIEHMNSGNDAYDIWVNEGDKVLLHTEVTHDEGEIINIYISDFVRYPQLKILALIFIVLVILIGRWQGIKSLIGLGITAFAIIQFMLPLLLKGYSPILLAIIVCIFSTILTILLISGFSIKSLTAILGTSLGVLIAGILSIAIGSGANLTGLSAQEAQMLMYIPQGVEFDFRGLLFAGIIIGALGAVMDVAMSISSSMEEIKTNNPDINIKDLVKSGLTVGKDIMGTMSNTLILAYVGSTIPLLLLFMAYEPSLTSIINMDLISTEIVRALTGSIGLLACIPVTASLYGLFSKKVQ